MLTRPVTKNKEKKGNINRDVFGSTQEPTSESAVCDGKEATVQRKG